MDELFVSDERITVEKQDSSWKETFSRVDKLFTPGLNAAIQAKEEKILSFRGATGAFILNSPRNWGELHYFQGNFTCRA